MAIKPSTKIIGANRRRAVLDALLLTPMTSKQLSQYLVARFGIRLPKQNFARMMKRLLAPPRVNGKVSSPLIKKFHYSTESRGELIYYKLTENAYRSIVDTEEKLPTKAFFRPISLSRQPHTRHLADIVVKFHADAQRNGQVIRDEYRENELALHVEQETLKPDRAFQLVTPRSPFNFLIENDEGSERQTTAADYESLQQKVEFYFRYQKLLQHPIRVLFFFSRPGERMNRFLEMARLAAIEHYNVQKCLCFAVARNDFLKSSNAFFSSVFTDHLDQPRALLTPKYKVRTNRRKNKENLLLPV